jgi:hypothetical protein
MKCRNCGLPREGHVEGVNDSGQRVWKCPNQSGSTFPASIDVKIELHYRTGEDAPWVATWAHPLAGAGRVVARQAAEALEAAGHQLERGFEEKSDDAKEIERATQK